MLSLQLKRYNNGNMNSLKSFEILPINNRQIIIYEDFWIDAEDHVKKYPRFYSRPCSKYLDILEKYDYVQISNGKELFWVQILDLFKSINSYKGVIVTTINDIDSLYNYGDYVSFNRENIFRIE